MGYVIKIAIFVLLAISYCPKATSNDDLPVELAHQVFNTAKNIPDQGSNAKDIIAYQKISDIFLGRKQGNLRDTLDQYPLHNSELTRLIKLYATIETETLQSGITQSNYKTLVRLSKTKQDEVGFMANLLLSVFHLKRFDIFIGMEFGERANNIAENVPATKLALNYQYDSTNMVLIGFTMDRNKGQSISTLERLLHLSDLTDRPLDGFIIVNNLANLYMSSNLPLKAIELIKTATPYLSNATYEQKAVYYFSLGTFQNSAQQYSEAIKPLKKAAELNKNLEMKSPILFQITKAYAHSGALKEAIKFKKLLMESKNADQYKKNLIKIDALIAELQGRPEDALALYKKWSDATVSFYNKETSDDRREASKRIALSQELSNQKLSQIVSENALKDQIIIEQKRKNKAYITGLALSILAIMIVLYLASRLNQSRKIAEIARDQATEGERAKEQILAAMSHEFRTPLNAIIPVADILETMHKDKATRNYLNMIRLAGESLLSMIENLYVLANGPNSQQNFTERLDLKKYIQDVLTPWIGLFHKKGLVLKAYMPINKDHSFEFDKRSLKLIIDNLVSNALKFTKNGTVELTINKISRQDSPYLEITVKDSGIGIELDKIDLYLSPFTQSDMSMTRSYGGLGIGLAAVKTCIEKYEGTINFENNQEAGTIVTVLLPLENTSETNTSRFKYTNAA